MTAVLGKRDDWAALLTRWHRDLGDNFAAVLPRVLDDLEAVDRAHADDPGRNRTPSDAELTAWIEAHPAEFAAWAARQARIKGAPPPFDTPTRQPTTRRRAAPKGGGAT